MSFSSVYTRVIMINYL